MPRRTLSGYLAGVFSLFGVGGAFNLVHDYVQGHGPVWLAFDLALVLVGFVLGYLFWRRDKAVRG